MLCLYTPKHTHTHTPVANTGSYPLRVFWCTCREVRAAARHSGAGTKDLGHEPSVRSKDLGNEPQRSPLHVRQRERDTATRTAAQPLLLVHFAACIHFRKFELRLFELLLFFLSHCCLCCCLAVVAIWLVSRRRVQVVVQFKHQVEKHTHTAAAESERGTWKRERERAHRMPRECTGKNDDRLHSLGFKGFY